jgi:type I restriction enzyme, S subunit
VNAPLAPLGDLVDICKRTLDPATLGDDVVEHFSIPAYDQARQPELVPASAIRSNKLRLDQPTVLLSKINPHIPRCWLAEPSTTRPALTSTEFLPLVPKTADTDLGYLFAVCSSRPFQRSLRRLVTGTSSSHQRVKPRDCLAVKVPVPDAAEQRRIGQVFTAITERTHVARETSRVANGLVRAAFRSTFDSGTGRQPLRELAEVSFGVSYRSAELNGTAQALVTLKCFGRTGEYRAEGLKPWSGTPKASQVLRSGDIVIAQTDLTQAGSRSPRARNSNVPTIGRLARPGRCTAAGRLR